MSLPYNHVPQEEPRKPTPAADKPASSRRVLVVDDNRDAATTLAMLLKLSGHQVTTAFCGLDAIAAVESQQPEIALLDIGLPDINGYEIARRLRQTELGKQITLVALTGWGQQEDRQRAAEAGFDHHIVKPVELSTLTALFDQLSAR